MKWHPVAASVLLALPFISQAADISMNNGSVASVNNVPVININQANAQGLSHNVYDKLNVDKNGVIFNNSIAEANSVLAGKIAGNSNLASGTAKVILNEVTSKNLTAINGTMEIAGAKADLIIANPNGITVNGGGTINAGKLTLTTGTPDIQNGQLAGYAVNGGAITLGQLNTTSPTEILARNVVVTDKVTTGDLNVVTGNNYVNAAGQVTGTVTATGSGSANSIDVAELGGMYANKINLVSTENGVGVRNLGVIAGGVNGVNIDANGQLVNNNARIESTGAVNIKTNGMLNNTTGVINSVGSIGLDTNKNGLVNTRAGNISTSGNLFINSGAIDNTDGKMAASGMLAVDTNSATFTNSGKGKAVGVEAGIVALKSGTLDNSNGQIKGGYVGLESTTMNNNSGLVDSLGNVEVTSTGDVDNTKGLLRSAAGYTKISAQGVVTNGSTKTADTASNDSLGIIAGKDVQILANSISNKGGQMASKGDVSLESSGAIDNDNGKIYTTGKAILKGDSLRNDDGGSIISKGGVNAALKGDITNYIGVIISEEGDIGLEANTLNNHGGLITGQNIDIKTNADLNNDTALIVANKTLKVDAINSIDNRNGNDFSDPFGFYFGMPQQIGGMIGKGGVSLTGNIIYNNNSRIVAENGPLSIQSKSSIDNTRALLMSGADSTLKTGWAFYNNYATTYAVGNITIDTPFMENDSDGSLIDNNATGIISADKNLTLNIVNNFTNNGIISSLGDAAVNVLNGVINNTNTLSSGKVLGVTALNGVENSKDISAKGDLIIDTQHYVTNNSNMVGKNVTITALDDLKNQGNIISSLAGNVIIKSPKGNVNNNNGKILSAGSVSITSNALSNDGGRIEADSDIGLIVDKSVTNNGSIKSNGALNFTILNGALYNLNDIYSGKELVINALSGIENSKDIVAGTDINLDTKKYVTNNQLGNILAENITINAGADIINRANLMSNQLLAVNTSGNIYNYLNLFSYSKVDVTAKNVTNNKGAVFGGLGGTKLTAGKLNNAGTVFGI
ncbi:two-partner secretion domain-containing protein [Izhakiella capsodis]|nr:filamentous hemagglutinin N-terminal domain-containing protein [Izhakiella capsodis]